MEDIKTLCFSAKHSDFRGRYRILGGRDITEPRRFPVAQGMRLALGQRLHASALYDAVHLTDDSAEKRSQRRMAYLYTTLNSTRHRARYLGHYPGPFIILNLLPFPQLTCRP